MKAYGKDELKEYDGNNVNRRRQRQKVKIRRAGKKRERQNGKEDET